MIPMHIACSAVFGIPQDLFPGTGMVPVMADFLSLFEQAITDSIPAHGADETVQETLMGGLDASDGEALPAALRSAPGGNGGKGSAGSQVSPAEALFAVLLCPPSQNPLSEFPDRPDDVADHSLPDANAAPVVGSPHAATTPSGIAQTVAVMSEPPGIRMLRIPGPEIGTPTDAPAPSPLPRDRRIAMPWVDVETQTANADGVPVGIEAQNTDPRAAVVIAGNQREDGTLSVTSPLAPLLKRKVGGMSVAALAHDGGSAGDVRSEESRSTRLAASATTSAREIQDRIDRAGNGQVPAQAADPLRVVVSASPGGRDVVVIDRSGVRFDVDRVADVTPRLSVVEPTRTPQIQQEDFLSGLFSDRQTLARPITAVGVAVTGEPTIVVDVADGRFQFVDFSGDVATHAEPDAPTERTMSGMASGPQSVAWDAQSSTAYESVVSDPSPAGDRNVIISAEAAEMQRNAGPAERDPHHEKRVGGAPRMATSEEAAVGTPLGRPAETVEQTSRSVRSAAVIARSIEPMADSDSERYGGDGLSRGIRQEHAGGARIVVPHSAKRDETPQDPQQDRWSAGSKDGSSQSDRSVSALDDGRGFGADLAVATALKGEHLRSNVSALSPRQRVVVEQVAEQIGRAAGISRRQDGESVQLRLHPQTLGELVVEVSWGESGIVAAIKTQSHVTGELLAADLGRLRIALEKQGFSVSDLGVQVGLDFQQWNSAGDGFHASRGIEYPAETIPRHDRRFALPAVAAIGPNSLIDITV